MMSVAKVQYISEAFYGDVLRVEVAIMELQTLGCDFVFRWAHRKTMKDVARVRTGKVFFDYASRRPRSTPQVFRDDCRVTAGRG